MAQGLGFMIWGAWIRVEGLWFRIQGLGLGMDALGGKVRDPALESLGAIT
jgi:hypothetical protein